MSINLTPQLEADQNPKRTTCRALSHGGPDFDINIIILYLFNDFSNDLCVSHLVKDVDTAPRDESEIG